MWHDVPSDVPGLVPGKFLPRDHRAEIEEMHEPPETLSILNLYEKIFDGIDLPKESGWRKFKARVRAFICERICDECHD